MRNQLASLLLLALADEVSARAIHSKRISGTISTSFTDNTTGSGSFGDFNVQTIIDPGVKVWLSGRRTLGLYGNIQNSGTLLVSQTDSDSPDYPGQSVFWQGGDASNGNLINKAGAAIILNDAAASSTPSYYWYLQSVENAGTIQWCSGGNTTENEHRLSSRSSDVNNGLIVFEYTKLGTGGSVEWRNHEQSSSLTPPATLTNNGGVLLRSITMYLNQNYLGVGCWMIGTGATMHLLNGIYLFNNPDHGPPLVGQTISFLDNTGILHFDPLAFERTPDFGASIHGFGQGNKLQFFYEVNNWVYAGSTLRVNFVQGSFVNLIIGSGYSDSDFTMTKTPYRHYIAYSGPAPLSSPPAQCLLTAPVCTALVSDSISASTTSSEAPPATTLTTAIPTTTSEGSPISSLLGCFQDSAQFGGVRTFNGPSYVDTNGLTNQACASFCTSKGFPISATEYSQECYCGGDVPTTGSAVCSKPCSGDPTQVCGGDWALSVSRTSNVPVNSVSSAPSPNVTAIDYIPFKYDGQLAGCFADAAETGGVRTLSGATYRDSSSLTNEKCANFCGEKGFAYSGTEDGQECWCSSTLPTVSSTRCDAACKGNTTQTCGGPWALTVTINQAIVEQSSSATPSQPPYTALGCFADSVNARVFGGFSYTNSSMTPAQCAAKCSSLFFPFSGTEFGNECFCSQSAPISTSTQCNKPCAGNLGLICGGPDALTVFQDTSVSPAVPPTCPGLPSAFVACTEGQRVSGGKCVSD